MIIFERRASVILFNLLRTRRDPRPFLLPGNVCWIVPDTFKAAGQAFEYVDIAEPWLEMDARQCLDCLWTEDLAGVYFVRPYGSERDPTPFFSELRAAQQDLLIIDDKCLCRPDCDGESLSPFAEVTLYSTGHVKFADIGAGGFAFLSGSVAYDRETEGPDWLDLRPPDWTWEEHRGRTIAAASAAISHKSALNAIYSSVIPPEVQLPKELQQWRFNLRLAGSEQLVAQIFESGLFASRHYPPMGNFPVAARVHAEIANLFNDRYFTEDQARRAAEIVVRHIEGLKK